MKKRIVLLSALFGFGLAASAQLKTGVETLSDAFWTKVDYIGAFGTDDWAAGWTNYKSDLAYAPTQITIGNGVQSVAGGLHISTNTTWAADKVIKLSGWVIVDSLTTLTIEAGALIRGELKSAIMVKRGGKLIAEGTKAKPIVFTSNNETGRTNYDWGGIILCGNAPNNNGSMAQYEGIADLYYGAVNGGKADDNSGSLKYVRIEHACIDFGNAKEVNALTLCAVGSGTTIDYVQTAFSGDDGFEFFGGTVNAKHLVSYVTEDDDFDTDNGWSGKVQFAVAMRDPNVVDSDPGRGFESDNDAAGSTASPVTSGTFSNVTIVGPRQQDSWVAVTNWAAKHDASMYLRRNTQLKVWNAIFIGNAKGLVIDGALTVQNAKDDKLQVKYTSLIGIAQADNQICDTASVKKAWSREEVKAWFLANHGEIKTSIFDAELTDPFTLTAPVFTAEAGTYAHNKSCWTDAYVTAPVTAVDDNSAPVLTIANPVKDAIIVPEFAVVIDILGAEVARGNNAISVANLPAGLYIVKTATQSVHIIKE